MRTRLIGLMVVAALLAAGCSDDDGDDEAEGETTTSTTSTATSSPENTSSSTATTGQGATTPASDEGCTKLTSSPSTYDAKGGQYAAYLTAVDVKARKVKFDVIQFLGGDDAVAAYKKDNPDDSEGPPNDYYIVNSSEAQRDVPVSPTVRVRLARQEKEFQLDAGTFEELPGYLDPNSPTASGVVGVPYWLTVSDGVVTDLCEQFLP